MIQRMKKKTVLACAAGFLCAAALAFFFLLPYPEPFSLSGEARGTSIYIAHAGGSIDGHTYTHSREAVNASVAAGFRFIELDLYITADNDLAALHDIGRFREMTGYRGTEKELTAAKVKSLSLLGRYTPLVSEDINELFADKRLYFVADKKIPPQLLLDRLTIDRERMLVEVFSYADYVEALRKGIRYPMLSMPEERHFTRNKLLLLTGKIAMVTTRAKLVRERPEMLRQLREKGIVVFASTINDPDFALRHLGTSIDGIYTDVLTPPAKIPGVSR